MSKRTPIAIAVGLAVLFSLPAASEAHCLNWKRWETRTTSVVSDTGRTVRRFGDGVVRTTDRMFGWLWCKKHRV